MNNIDYNFNNKTILITAGTSGIGLELAKQFLNFGANVAIFSSNKKNIILSSKTLKKFILKKKVLIFRHNLENFKNTKKIINKVKFFFKKKINILINNSGGPPSKSILKTTNSDWNRALSINLLSAINFSKFVIPDMKSQGWGRIINLTSLTAKEPAQNMVLSNVSRSALASFSKTLAIEVGLYGITVNTILTGGCLTNRLFDLIKLQEKNKKNLQVKIKKLGQQIPVGKIAKTYEFVQTILFLASNNSSYINGIAIPIDGGASKSIF